MKIPFLKFSFFCVLCLLPLMALTQIKPSDEVFTTAKGFDYYFYSPCIKRNELASVEFDYPVKVHLIRLFTCDLENKKLKGDYFYKVVVDGKVYSIPVDALKFNYSTEQIYKGFRKFKETDKNSFKELNEIQNRVFFDEYHEKREQERIERERIQQEEERRRLEQERIERERIEKLRKIEALRLDSVNEMSARQVQVNYELQYDADIIKADSYRDEINRNGGLIINEFEVSTNDYNVTNITLGVFNSSTEKVKYVEFKLKAINPVGDQVGRIATLEGVGFVNSNSSGRWEFENVWYQTTLHTVKILSVKITYESGRQKTVKVVGDIMDTSLDKTIYLMMESRDYEMFGAISFKTYKDWSGMYSIDYRGLNNGEMVTITLFKEAIVDEMEALKMAIQKARNNEVYQSGIFNVRQYSSNIYIRNEDNTEGYTFISLENAERLLKKFQSIVE